MTANDYGREYLSWMDGSVETAIETFLNAEPQQLIAWFDDFGDEPNNYRFLSNFYIGEPIVFEQDVIRPLDGVRLIRAGEYMTNEHVYAAAKANNDETWERIRSASGPGRAKGAGRGLANRDDWGSIKHDVMQVGVAKKFELGRDEADLLEVTGDALLVEGTYWGDPCWGVDLNTMNRPGANWLGTILMAQRARNRYLIRFRG